MLHKLSDAGIRGNEFWLRRIGFGLSSRTRRMDVSSYVLPVLIVPGRITSAFSDHIVSIHLVVPPAS
jgi:hypothetical protein